MFTSFKKTITRPFFDRGESSALIEDSRSIISLAIPLILSQVAQTGIFFFDSLLMGRLGPEALAGGALALSTFYLAYVLAFGVVSASGNLVAIAHGAGRADEVAHSVRAGLLVTLLVSLILGVALCFVEPLMLRLGQNPKMAAAAQSFLHVLVWGMPFGLLFLSLRGFASGIGYPKPVPSITFTALLLFVAMGWSFSQIWGLNGIALASALTYVYMGCALSWVVVRHPRFRVYRIFRLDTWQADLAMIKPLLRIGLPTSGTLGLESALFNLSAWFMGALGVSALAAHQSMMQLVIVSFIVPLGMMYAVSMRVGQAAGACDWPRAKRINRLGQMMAIAWTLLMAVILLLIPEPLIVLFLPDGREGVEAARQVAYQLAPFAALLVILDAWQAVACAALRALKDARASMLIYALGCVGVAFPLAWGLSLTPLKGQGVWIGMCAGLFLVCVLLRYRFEKRLKTLELANQAL